VREVRADVDQLHTLLLCFVALLHGCSLSDCYYVSINALSRSAQQKTPHYAKMYLSSRSVNPGRLNLRRLYSLMGRIRMTKYLICAALALPIAAAAAPKFDQAAMEKARRAAQAETAIAKATATGVKGGTAAGEVTVNPFRSYPASCLQSPLAFGMWSGNPEAVQANITLFGDAFSSDAGERNYLETDTITVFRLPCADGYSVSLIEIDRPSNVDGHTDRYPTLPGVTFSGLSTTGASVTGYPLRYSDDVNTFFANNFANSPLYTSNVYVLENYYNSNAPQLNYNQAFTLTIDDFATSQNLTQFPLATYNPAHYAATSQPLPVSGYMSTNWGNPDENGEGIIVQVYDIGNSTSRVFSFAWFTYDDAGFPLWIYGDTEFPIGSKTVTVPTLYFANGAFAGSIAAGANFASWGNATFSFPDCEHMTVSYNGSAAPINNGHKQGSKTFARIANVNGLACI